MKSLVRATVTLLVVTLLGVSAHATPANAQAPQVPANSGNGRRIVYDIGSMHVWLVEEDGTVFDDHPVSGHKYSTLPGTGEFWVFSKSRYTGVAGTKTTFEFMVRFAWGANTDLAIGFHSIPIKGNGTPVQTTSQLGSPRSNGCVRQKWGDAQTLWNWAPIGTYVTVIDTSGRARPAPADRFPDGPRPPKGPPPFISLAGFVLGPGTGEPSGR